MDKNHLAEKIKELRNKRGMSQEVLAEESGLSLRTIQRIENSNSNPTGETLKRLSNTLHVTPDELIDWSVKKDTKSLLFLNLSALTFLFFPLLGILVPFIVFTNKKGKVKNIDTLGRDLINFEITWNIVLFSLPILLFILSKTPLIENLTLKLFFISIGVLYFFNLCFILFNTLRINNENITIYYPKIKFLK